MIVLKVYPRSSTAVKKVCQCQTVLAIIDSDYYSTLTMTVISWFEQQFSTTQSKGVNVLRLVEILGATMTVQLVVVTVVSEILSE